MRKLRIGQIGPLNLPIPPKKYGGTERIIDSLCRGLSDRGHEVFLFSAKDSKTKAKIIPIVDKSLWLIKPKDTSPYYAYEMAVIAKKAEELKLDILHDHLGPWALTLYGQINIPIIHTLHVPLGIDRAWAYRKLKSRLVSISDNQKKEFPELRIKTIYNGIDLKSYKFNAKPENHFIWIGELSPRKGIREVIEFAKKTKIELVIAGKIPPPTQSKDYAFFNKFIKKELGCKNIHFIGEVHNPGKYFRTARAFLYPLQWEEPFGLTVVESMACGTPVIAYNRGSMAELIEDGKTGFLVDDHRQMESAIKKIDGLDRAYIRKYTEANFSEDVMVDNYEPLYYKLLKK